MDIEAAHKLHHSLITLAEESNPEDHYAKDIEKWCKEQGIRFQEMNLLLNHLKDQGCIGYMPLAVLIHGVLIGLALGRQYAGDLYDYSDAT